MYGGEACKDYVHLTRPQNIHRSTITYRKTIISTPLIVMNMRPQNTHRLTVNYRKTIMNMPLIVRNMNESEKKEETLPIFRARHQGRSPALR